MQQTEIILFWMTVFMYVAAFCVHVFGFVRASTRTEKAVMRLLWAGMVLHTATALARWSAAGHAPVTDTYELNLTGTWFTVLIFLVFERLKKIDRSIALVVTPVVFLVLGHGVMLRSAPIPMGTAYQSPWLVVHVIFAWLSFGCFAIAFGAAVLFLARDRFPGWEPITRVPDVKGLDLAGYRFIVLGFINHAVMLVSGAIWAKKLWGHYWSWDVLEIWSLITFLFYAFYLHVRSFLGWRMRRSAWLTVLGFVVLAISFWGVQWFSPVVRPGHEWNERSAPVVLKKDVPKNTIKN
ncbi:MAG: cytochrome c biogenesis protein CcsA [Desulfobacterales bacterium]|nr:cytochrome c biogenesis protein CcsA [Desulfobacteraceae bacterium]MDH3574142.1 cytochrome c biogenesis protein CcsA [Desulfobacteraceae bacterium]MDH3721652.1 cytochrome c biogenesis protein CcsA [Desulfobacteraceae bacterium]MDH3825800.1 cytochrome c biogenesis protein CcsA [Desulfobacterales bacterium]MDH3836502.1 cytochrome c biogenesis protein CcsA [Desulfobacteraceae bacterium]